MPKVTKGPLGPLKIASLQAQGAFGALKKVASLHAQGDQGAFGPPSKIASLQAQGAFGPLKKVASLHAQWDQGAFGLLKKSLRSLTKSLRSMPKGTKGPLGLLKNRFAPIPRGPRGLWAL